jgi:hypothetical protein
MLQWLGQPIRELTKSKLTEGFLRMYRRVDTITQIEEVVACNGSDLVVGDRTVSTTEVFESCGTLTVGSDFYVEAPGDVTLRAAGTIGFRTLSGVNAGASLRVQPNADLGLPSLSSRSFGYQDYQYFLSSGDGPWGTLDWTYDRIGNRLSEIRDGAPADTYVYEANTAGTGNRSRLDRIHLGMTGTRDYTFGSAGHLEQVAAGANVVDFTSDEEGRLTGLERLGNTASMRYDGRSFLERVDEGDTGNFTEPTYSSEGMLYSLFGSQDGNAITNRRHVLYFAGRPVGILEVPSGGSENCTFLSTDHLGRGHSSMESNLLVATTGVDTLLLLRVDARRAERAELKTNTGGYYRAVASVGQKVFGLVGCPPHTRNCVRGLYAVSLDGGTAKLLIDGTDGHIWTRSLAQFGGLLYLAGREGLLEIDPETLSSRTVARVEFARYATSIVESEGRLYFFNRETALQWVDPLTGQRGSQSFEIPNPGNPEPAVLAGIVDGCMVFGDAKGRHAIPLDGAASNDASCARLRRPAEGGRTRSTKGLIWVLQNYEFPIYQATLTEIGSGRRVRLRGLNVRDWCFLPVAPAEDETT